MNMQSVRKQILGVLAVLPLAALSAATNHVSKTGSDATGDGASWATAWATIGHAVQTSTAGDTVLVSNGVYTITAQITIAKDLTVRGFSGDPRDTAVNGGGAALTCFLLSTGDAVVESLTISNAYRGAYLDSTGTVRNCILSHHRQGGTYSTGAYLFKGGLVENCVSSNNVSRYIGPGVYLYYGGRVRNSLIAYNRCGGSLSASGGGAVIQTAGVIEGCTIANNYAEVTGGGVCIIAGGYVTNSVFFNNTAPYQADCSGLIKLYNCCLKQASVTGANNVIADPLLVDAARGDFRLLAGSPCVDGVIDLPGSAVSVDLDGQPRQSGARVDIGCYEYHPGALQATFTATPAHGVPPLQVVFTGHVAGTNLTSLQYAWDFDNDGNFDTVGTERFQVTNVFANAGRYTPRLVVSNGGGETASRLYPDLVQLSPSVVYVAQSGNVPAYPYGSWATAADSLHDALAAAAPGMTVLVGDGHYVVTNLVTISDGRIVRGANGRQNVIVDGDGKFRCFYLNHPESTLESVTITNGYALTVSGVEIWAGTVRDAHIVGNGIPGSSNASGGFFIHGNDGQIVNSLIERNTGQRWGAGGGTATYGVISNCWIVGNRAADAAAGGIQVSGSTLVYNCLIAGNTCLTSTTYKTSFGAVNSGGCVLDACTIVDNLAGSAGAVRHASGGTYMRNCIVRNNFDYSTGLEANWTGLATAYTRYNCTTPTIGTACQTGDPGLRRWGGEAGLNYPLGDYRLNSGSPCIDNGENQAWMTGALDLRLQPRIYNGTVDIGAIEWYPPEGSRLILR